MTTDTQARFDLAMKVKAVAGDGPMRVTGVASSNAVDLGGDSFAVSALQAMKRQFDSGLIPIAMDHHYGVSESVFGKVIASRLKTADATGITDLEIDVQISQSNPAAIQVYNTIANGEVPLGFSVGCLVTDAGPEKIDGKNVTVIRDCVLLECSVVMIPANPSSRGLTAKSAALLCASQRDGAGADPDVVTLVKFLLTAANELQEESDRRDIALDELMTVVNRAMDQPLARKASDTFAEGIATRVTFDLTFELMKRYLHDFVLLSEDELAGGVRLALRATHNLAEGAGAAAIAAASKMRPQLTGKRVVAVMSGGNLDAARLRWILGASS